MAFVWGPESCGIFMKPECYMINVLKLNCGLNPYTLCIITYSSHFLPPVVALSREENDNAKMLCYLIICKLIALSAGEKDR